MSCKRQGAWNFSPAGKSFLRFNVPERLWEFAPSAESACPDPLSRRNAIIVRRVKPCQRAPRTLVRETRRVVDAFRKGPHIFNLGHGITPDASPDNVQLMIDTVRGA